ncbi:uncharacterized protein LOC131217048 [Magnolia sinica]|uniref:uncharacterized protein LOC131217048 n=1 Tax=Magnolia sinica TaxID=86752 RepID=UPI00265B0E23|nr:uncharacterized protein LOC131217048 [Magnolia sinica]
MSECFVAENSICSAMAETEVAALKEALRAQHHILPKLDVDLEEEREASATAASEALSMILRLQEEKAAEKMEACQYKRMAEEKLRHVEESLAVFEEIMLRKEMEIVSLKFQVQAYRHKLLSIGFPDLDVGEMGFLENRFLHNKDVYSDNVIVHGTVRRYTSLPAMRSRGLNREKWGFERRPSFSLRRENDNGMGCKFDVRCVTGSSFNHENSSRAYEPLQNVSEESVIEDCISPSEEIVKDPSLHNKPIDGENQLECVSENKEPQATISANTLCLGIGLMSCSHGPFYNLTGGRIIKLDSEGSCLCSHSQAEDLLNFSDFDVNMDSEVNGNSIQSISIQDIFEIPQNHECCEFLKPKKEVMQKLILEAENRLGMQDLALKGTLEYYFEDEKQQTKKALICAPHLSELCMKRNGITVDWALVDSGIMLSPSQVEFQQLNKRLQLLEDDSQILKQEASDRRNEELKLLGKICEQLQSIEFQIRSKEAKKRSLMDDFAMASVMNAMLRYML